MFFIGNSFSHFALGHHHFYQYNTMNCELHPFGQCAGFSQRREKGSKVSEIALKHLDNIFCRATGKVISENLKRVALEAHTPLTKFNDTRNSREKQCCMLMVRAFRGQTRTPQEVFHCVKQNPVQW